MDDQTYTVRVPKRWARIAMIVGVTALIVAPLTAVATNAFDDVPETNTHHDDITWLKAAAVTQGCNPPDNTEYCPDDSVTRAQMATFMRNLTEYMDAEDGTPALADHATTADSADSVADGAITAPKLGTVIDRTNSTTIATGNGGSVSVDCEADEVLISGGTQTAGVGSGAQDWSLIWSGPSDNGWSAAARNDKGSDGDLIVHALCLQP